MVYLILLNLANEIKDDVVSVQPSISAALSPDVSYSVRHVEESWHHLMRSEDTKKLKEIAVCNFDFLLASVSNLYIIFILSLNLWSCLNI